MGTRGAALGLAVAICMGCGGAGPAPFYDPTAIEQTATPNAGRSGLIASVKAAVGDRPLFVRGPDGERRALKPGDIADLQPSALKAIAVSADRRFEGAEVDVWVALPGGERVPVTVRRTADGPIDVEVGRGGDPGWPEPPAQGAFGARYGIGPVKNGKRRWLRRDLRSLAMALDRLAPAELKLLDGMPFVRGRRGKTVDRGAQYVQRDCAARIVAFDRAFAGEKFTFIGPADAPLPIGVFALLHEFAHALHHRPGRLAQCALIDAVNTRNALGKTLNADIARFNRAARKANRGDAAAQRIVDRLGPTIEQRQKRLRASDRELAAETARVKRLSARGPVLDAWRRAVGDAGPTPYGRSALAESFAEAFALFRADPAALKRALPKGHAFFAAGRHLESSGLPAP